METIVLVEVAINFHQTHRSQRAVERLREAVASTATVLRDGDWVEVLRRELVPGDVIRLGAGELVPADARLVQARALHVQQAALTGCSRVGNLLATRTNSLPGTPEVRRGRLPADWDRFVGVSRMA
jgi:Mg2+-importing ATPase